MNVIDPGHLYELDILDSTAGKHRLRFVKRSGDKYPGNIGSYPGTTLQEVLRACHDRLQYVNNQIPCQATIDASQHIARAIFLLEVRAAKRHNRVMDFDMTTVLNGPFCPKCGHVGCKGECHK